MPLRCTLLYLWWINHCLCLCLCLCLWTPMSSVPKKADKLNLSLSLSSIQLSMGLGFGIADKLLGRKDYILACWYIQMTCIQFINAYRYYCPSVHLSGNLGSGLGLGWASGSGWLLPSLREICCHYRQHILVQSSLADRKLREQKLRGYQNLWCYQTVYWWLSARLQ